MKPVTAQLLAGYIIKNQLIGQAIVANTVEVYGRKKKQKKNSIPPFLIKTY